MSVGWGYIPMVPAPASAAAEHIEVVQLITTRATAPSLGDFLAVCGGCKQLWTPQTAKQTPQTASKTPASACRHTADTLHLPADTNTQELHNSEVLSDITIRSDDGLAVLKCHKLVLIRWSAPFRRMLCGGVCDRTNSSMRGVCVPHNLRHTTTSPAHITAPAPATPYPKLTAQPSSPRAPHFPTSLHQADMREAREKDITLHGVDGEVLAAFIRFLYTCNCR